MKKLSIFIWIVAVWLIACNISAQQTITSLSSAAPNATIMRGDSTKLTISIIGNYASQKLMFTVKASKISPTADALITKKNSLNGGSDSEVTALYSGTTTTIYVYLNSINTADFESSKYYYDIKAQKVGSSNYTTLLYGDVNVRPDVGNINSGAALAENGTRYVPVDTTQITEGQAVIRSGDTFIGADIYTQSGIDAIFGGYYNKIQVDAIAATKEPVLASGLITQYYRGDKTWATLNKDAVLLGNVDNTSDANKPISIATQTALDRKRDLTNHDSLSALDEKDFASLTNKPTTLAGYSITDAYTQHEIDSLQNLKQNVIGYTPANEDSVYHKSSIDSFLALKFNASDFASYFDTRFNSYISNYYTKHLADSLLNLKQAALNGAGFVKISGTTISYDNSTYLTTETDPTVYSWAKASTKPSYSYSEISGLGTIAIKDSNSYYRSTNPSNFIALTNLSSSALGLTYTNTTGAFSWTAGFMGLTDSMRTLWSGKQSYYANLSSIGALANATGWLKNDGSGNFSYSTPTATDVGLGNVTNESKATMFTKPTFTDTTTISVLKLGSTTITATGAELNLTHSLKSMAFADSVLFKAELAGLYVPLSRTVNGKALTSNISLAYSDLTSSAINIGTNTITSGAITSSGNLSISKIDAVASLTATNNGGTSEFRFKVYTYQQWGIGSNLIDNGDFYIKNLTDNIIALRFGATGAATFASSVSATNVWVGYTSDPTSGNTFAVNGNSYFNGTGIFAGSVGIGVSPAVKLHVETSTAGDYSTKLINTSATGWGTLIQGGADGGDYVLNALDYLGNPLFNVKADGTGTFMGLLISAGLTLSSGAFAGNSVTRGTNSFTTTATADTVAITGASVNDVYMVNYTTAVTSAEAPLSVVSTATGFIVTRPAGTTSGATYAWIREK